LRAPTPDDYYRLGHAHLLGGERASALEAFERAGAPGLLPRARHADDPAAARALYAEAAKATADPAPLAERGVFEMRHQAWAAAAEALDEAVRRGDRSLSTLYNRVLALRSAGRPEPALEALKEALREHPLDERLRSLLR
ncbi:MAG TPA: hypothetical protein VEJ18_04190, partial [Planctomycetota bacterium]|nr:hypothetical protein [Planctomycetota bacterium]